jgi:photosystem II stability/assembly factor-like uncharacterized protein
MRWLLLLPLIICLAACAPGNGIFAAGAWQSGGLQNQHIRALAVDPNNPQNIYAGDAQDGLFVSTDAGMHWTLHSTGLPLPTTIHALGFDDPGKRLYAATDAGVFVSLDAAQHWAPLRGLPADSYTALAFDLKAPQTIYTATLHTGVFVSTNNGSTWTAANGGLPGGISINGLAFDTYRHQLWAATNMGIYRSGNARSTWQALNTGLPSAVIVNTVFPAAVSGGDQNLVFAGTNHGFFLSKDYGAHWAASQEALSGTSVNAILIDYHQVTTVYAAIGIGVLRSNDNGQNWEAVASGMPKDQPVFALAMGASGYNQLYAASNNVYLYPGNSSVFDPSQIFPILLVLAFFFALYRLSARGRKRSRRMLGSRQGTGTQTPASLNTSAEKASEKVQFHDELPTREKPGDPPEDEDRKGSR